MDYTRPILEQIYSAISSVNAAQGGSPPAGAALDTSIGSVVIGVGLVAKDTSIGSVVTGLGNIVSRVNSLNYLLGPTTMVGTTGIVSGFVAIATGGSVAFYGYAVTETGSAVANVVLRHGQTNSAPVLGGQYLLARGQAQQINAVGVSIPNGLYVDVLAGVFSLSLFTK